MNLPNILTVGRMVLVMIFVVLAANAGKVFFPDGSMPDRVLAIRMTAYVLAILAGVTDLLDGFLARKYHLESDFGRLVDPLADKIFVVGTFVMMAEYKLMPGWIIIVVLTREFMVTGLRMLATHKGVVISADKWGKIKTILQMVSLLIGGGAWIGLFDIHRKEIWIAWYVLLLIMTLVTILSGVGYFLKNKNLYTENT